MILRRVMAHVRAQNWLAVALDFLIVVVGVFIGLQVQEWSEARAERSLERVYIGRLADDLRADIHGIDWMIEIYQTKQEVLLDLRDGPPSVVMEGDPEEAARNLDYTAWKGVPGPRLAIYDELIGSGNLSLLQDLDLRNALADYYSHYTRTKEILAEPIGEYQRLFTQSVPGDIPIENLENADAATIRRIIGGLEVLQAEPGFEQAVNSELYYGRDMENWLVIHREQATSLLAMMDSGGDR